MQWNPQIFFQTITTQYTEHESKYEIYKDIHLLNKVFVHTFTHKYDLFGQLKMIARYKFRLCG